MFSPLPHTLPRNPLQIKFKRGSFGEGLMNPPRVASLRSSLRNRLFKNTHKPYSSNTTKHGSTSQEIMLNTSNWVWNLPLSYSPHYTHLPFLHCYLEKNLISPQSGFLLTGGPCISEAAALCTFTCFSDPPTIPRRLNYWVWKGQISF